MRQQNFFPSFQITPPFGGVIIRAILILVIFITLFESAIRLGVSTGVWNKPLLGTINAELDLKIQMLDKQIESKPVNCIILGSSQTDAALDPKILSDAYYKSSGKQLDCFNFSLGTLTAGPAGIMARVLVDRYHPKFLIVGISARDFSRDFGELSRDFKNDPWINYSLGDRNIPGWLTENSMAFRFLSDIRSQLNSDYQSFHSGLLIAIQSNGYLLRNGNDLDIDSAPNIPKFHLNSEDITGLEKILAMNSKDLQVVVLEIPVYDKFLNRYVQNDPDSYYSLFRQPVEVRINSRNIPFIQSQEAMKALMPDTGWNDPLHLNNIGAEVFDNWFVQKLIEKIDSSNNPE